MTLSESGFQEDGPDPRQDLRIAALEELRAKGEAARAARHRPSADAIAVRFQLPSVHLAARLGQTRRLAARLSALVPRPAPPVYEPTGPADEEPGAPAAEYSEFMPAMPQASPLVELFGGERLTQIIAKLCACIECLNLGALLSRDDMRGLTQDYGEAAVRFGLKFRSSVPPWILAGVRGGQGVPHQYAATAFLAWSEVEQLTLPADITTQIEGLKPVILGAKGELDDTVEFVRLAVTATKAES